MGGRCSKSIPIPPAEEVAGEPFHDLAMAVLVPKCQDCPGPGVSHVASSHELQDGREWLDVMIDTLKPEQPEVHEVFLSMCRKSCFALAKHLVEVHKCVPAERDAPPEAPPLFQACDNSNNIPIVDWLITTCEEDPREVYNEQSLLGATIAVGESTLARHLVKTHPRCAELDVSIFDEAISFAFAIPDDIKNELNKLANRPVGGGVEPPTGGWANQDQAPSVSKRSAPPVWSWFRRKTIPGIAPIPASHRAMGNVCKKGDVCLPQASDWEA
jgi:hypothetical protein